MFVRLMRDYGLDFYRYDKFCLNLFAKGFEVENETKNTYHLATAFEVFEHFTQPLDDIKMVPGFSGNILFSTLLLPQNVPRPGDWWYYALDTGQHIAFYSLKTLVFIDQRFNLNLYTNGTHMHLLTEKKLPGFLFKWVSKYKVALMLSLFYRRKSLIQDDYHQTNRGNIETQQ